MIQLQHLTKRYGAAVAVEDLSLEVGAGELLVLLGESGCGKTTTVKMINRLIDPTAGRVLVEGVEVDSIEPHALRRRIGYVFQKIGLFPHMTVPENVGITLTLLGWDQARITRRVDALLHLVELDPAVMRARWPAELSGGQQQRVGVARALAAEPRVMLLDEPFGALDPLTRGRLQESFARIRRDLRLTAVFVTHDIAEALLAVMVPLLAALSLPSIGLLPAFIALTLYGVLPVLRNTVTGLAGVDPALREAARGVGMTPWQQLRRVELPLAMPVMVAGLRTSTVWVVGMATLSTPVGAPSLGNYIFSGLQTRNFAAVLVGCFAAAGLALVLDGLVHAAEAAST